MILHQDEPMNVQSFYTRAVPNDSEEDVMVIVIVEDLLAIDPSVHHVNAQTFDVEPKWPCHVEVKSKRRASREFDETLGLREV
jgi:hypothetical protein